MSQSPDCKHLSVDEILEILRSQADSLPHPATSSRYLSALRSLKSSVFSLQSSESRAEVKRSVGNEAADECLDGLSQGENTAHSADSPYSILKTSLTDWLINQWLMNIPFSTASLYLDIISSLYGSAVREGLLPKTTLFSELKTSLKALGPEGWNSGIDDGIFVRALRLTRNDSSLIADDAIAADLVIWSLTHGLIPLESIALLKKEDIANGEAVSNRPVQLSPRDAIIGRYCTDARRKYIFPLRQSERTPSQLKKNIAKIVNALFRRARLPQSTDPFQTVEALWAYAALRTGVAASAIVSHLGHAPLGLPVMKLSVMGGRFPNSPVPSGDRAASEDLRLKTEDLTAIGRVFLENPAQWYAMSLRPGIRFTQVCRRLALLQKTEDSRLRTEDIKLFYPCEEIARAIGKKIVVKQRPFINSVVFFKAKRTDIGPLFAKIGDLAWCYRESARPGAPYAAISERQFQLFQQTIARFTPDYEVAPSGELELKKNDRVRIVGGPFAGHEATFDSIVDGTAVSNRRVPSVNRAAGLSKVKPESGAEDSRLKTEDSNASGVVYRLNIIGDNGIEWRITTDSRLINPTL